MGPGISLTNENLHKTCLRMTYHDGRRQMHSDMREMPYLMQTQRRDHRHGDNRAMPIMLRRSIGYYESLLYDGRETKLESLAVAELVTLRKAAEAAIGRRFSSGCIAVPPCYFDLQRHALREAAQQCGLAEVALINEPVALLKQRPTEGKVLVACLDDGVFYVSVLEQRGAEIIELASGGDPKWGGVELLDALAQQAIRDREWPLFSTKSEQWQWGMQAASEAVYRLIEYQEITPEYQRLIVTYTLAAQQKTTAEILKTLEAAGVPPGEVTACLQIGTFWRLPGLDVPFEGLAARREQVSPQEIAAGALIYAEERFAVAPNVSSIEMTLLPPPAPAIPPAVKEIGASGGEAGLTDSILPRRSWQPAAPPVSGDSPPALSYAAPVPSAEGNLPGEQAPSYSSQTGSELLGPDELTAAAQRCAAKLSSRSAVAFYKDLIEKLSEMSAELCLQEAEKARVAGESSASLRYLREGFQLSPLESIRRRLADACCSEAEKKERDPQRLEDALELAAEALHYDPGHERAKQLKRRLDYQKNAVG